MQAASVNRHVIVLLPRRKRRRTGQDTSSVKCNCPDDMRFTKVHNQYRGVGIFL